jgi:hypothetical protein
MSESERRSGSRIALRDLLLEIVVIILIGGEIWLGAKQGKDEDLLMGKQNGILTNLQSSTSDTANAIKALADVTKAMSNSTSESAKTLLSLRATTETMNKGVHDQVTLFYDPSLELTFNVDAKRLLLRNTGRTTITLTGIAIQNGEQNLDSPRMVAASSEYYFDLTPLYETLSARIPKGASESVPVKINIKNEQGKEFVLDAVLLFVWDKDKIFVYVHPSPLTPKP